MRNQNSNRERIARACVYAICIAAVAGVGVFLQSSFSVRAQQKSAAPQANTNLQIRAEATGFYCNLKAFTTAERIRHEQLSKKLRDASVEIKELSDGFAFRMQAEAVSLPDLAEWVSGERKCCPLFDFGIDLQGDGGPLWLEAEGKEGVTQFLRPESQLSGAQTGAHADKPAEHREMARTVSQVLDYRATHEEKKLTAIAEVMPADKYQFAPTDGEFKGVRTFGEQVKHLSATNFILGAAILGEAPPADAGDEMGPDSVRTKPEIIQYLKDSFVYLHKAVAAIDGKNELEPSGSSPISPLQGKVPATRLGLTMEVLLHSYDHYGQLVEYLRMNGIVPPGSR